MEDGVRDTSVLRKLLGLCVSTVVVMGRELVESHSDGRDRLEVWVRTNLGASGLRRRLGAQGGRREGATG